MSWATAQAAAAAVASSCEMSGMSHTGTLEAARAVATAVAEGPALMELVEGFFFVTSRTTTPIDRR